MLSTAVQLIYSKNKHNMLKNSLTLLILLLFAGILSADNGDPEVTLCSGEKMSWKEYLLYKEMRSSEYDIEIEYMSNENFIPFRTSEFNSNTGAWSSVFQMPLVASAAANLPDGRVMTWSARDKLAFGGDQGRTWTAIFDPNNNSTAEFLIENTGHDMFCPGTVSLPDGRILVMGGSSSAKSSVYDPITGQWSTGDQMNIARGYLSSVTLASGATFAIGGSWSGGVGGKDAEIWSEKTGWFRLPGVPVAAITDGIVSNQPEKHDDYFPWLWVAPDGRLLHAGPSSTMHWIDPTGVGSYTNAGQRGDDGYSISGTTVMYDIGKVLKAGGAGTFEEKTPANNRTYVIDMNGGGNPQVTKVGNMNYTRNYHDAVVLPDGQVFVVGGIPISEVFSDANSRLVPELWNPATGQWTAMAPMATPRNYHSVALLMQDGRVFVAGSGLCNTCSTNHSDGEIFSPPYLFNGNGTLATRPTITSAPGTAAFNSNITVNTNAGISSFVLVRQSAVTHSTNNEQRRIPLNATALGGNQYQLSIPNRNIVVPGEYMLFAMNNNGTPSIAKVIKVGDDINDCTPTSNPNLGGSGLQATYFNNMNLTSPVLTRTDATVNFNWGTGAPAAGVGAETFSVRWEGEIQVPRTGTYTFYTNSDDGVRLWVDGKLMVDNWTDHGVTEDIGMITLDPNQLYDIKLEYYENTQGAVMQLRWSGPGVLPEIIPAQNLFPPNPCGGNTGPCNDGNACTVNDMYDASCNCVGTFQDSDNDGVCNANDQCPGFDDGLIGTACDDGNANTTNDTYQTDCSCAGTPVGNNPDCNDINITTGSGSIIVAGIDGAPVTSVQVFSSSWATIYTCFADCNSPIETVSVANGDYIVYVKYYTANYQLVCSVDGVYTVGGGPCTDNDDDGVCANQDCDDNNPNLPTTVGSTCNDGNPNTNNDVIQADGCTCAGTPVGGGDCNDINISTAASSITVSGLNSPITQVQIFDPAWNQVLNCSGDCNTTETISSLSAGTYFVKARLYGPTWNFICEVEEYVNVGGAPCTDNDGDGTCADQDCDDNDASLPTTVGSACNDGNSNTNNDVIQADGCTCAGTPVGGSDCSTVSITPGDGTITVGGLDGAPITHLQAFTSNWQSIFNCAGNCNATEVLEVSQGDYIIFVKYYDAGWNFICEVEENVTVGDGGPPPPPPSNGDCSSLNMTTSANAITVSGLDATPIAMLQVYDGGWQEIFKCIADCDATQTISGLANDTYFVKVTLLNNGWGTICTEENYITIGTSNSVSHQNQEDFLFAATSEKRVVDLNWITNTESKNKLFIVERSVDGIDFEEIARIESEQDLLNAHFNYNSIDGKPFIGKNYYRILKEHHDGSKIYSALREVIVNPDISSFKVYPNPAAGSVYVNIKEFAGLPGQLVIYNNLGQVMNTWSLRELEGPSTQLSIADYTSGLYFVSLQVEGRKTTTKRLMVGDQR